MSNLLRAFDAPENPNVPELRSGDNVSVHVRFKEGDNERTQIYKGTVIRVRGSNNNATFTVRRIASNGIGVERTFLVRSPIVDKLDVHRHSKVRRSRLYYLRERSGKSARLKQRFAK